MKNKILILFIAMFSLSSFAIAQQKPKVILPGEKYTVSSKKDTLWVISNSQLRKSIIAKKELKICNKQLDNQKDIISKLKESNQERQLLIDTLKSDRDFYNENWQKAEDDVKILANMNNKCSKHLKIAIIVGGTTTVIAFLAGFLIAL